jgi:hypothetical protein
MVTLNAANEKFNAVFGLLCPILNFMVMSCDV